MLVPIETRIQHKRDIEVNWNASSLVPLEGELIIYDPDSEHAYPRVKFGDGIKLAKDLPFVHNTPEHKISDIESLDEILNTINPAPDIETTDDVLVALGNLRQELSTLQNTIGTLTQTVDSLIPAIGEIYITTSAEQPYDKFKVGTWEQIKDMFLLAAGDTWEAGTSGGEAEHILTEEELAPHHHYHEPASLTAQEAATGGFTVGQATNKEYVRIASAAESNDTGGGQAHNNMPPYLAVYIYGNVFLKNKE